MKFSFRLLCVAFLSSLLAAGDSYGRGGGGFHGGGGYRGGGFSPSMSHYSGMNRSPSMSQFRPGGFNPSAGQHAYGWSGASRPGGRPEFSGGGSFQRPGGWSGGAGPRPTNQQLQNFLHLPGEGQGVRPAVNPRADGWQHPGTGQGVRPSRPAQLPDRGQVANQIQSHWDHRPDGNRPFTKDWWKDHQADHHHVPPWHPWNHWNHWPNRWWGWATPVVLTGWLPYGWTTPYYYDYGPGGNVTYEGDTVYVNNQPAGTAQQYYDQAETLASNVPQTDSPQSDDDSNWLPLGVFALTQEGVDDSNVCVQLAVNKQGVIAGTYYNETTQATRPLQGSVDKQTQRAAWTYADGQDTNLVMETSVYNLTKDQCTVLVHFGPEQTQTWVMVRLKDSDQQAAQQPAQLP
ncbi:MAG TPA: hypothetical protein VJL29_12400 [Thermoguttaceae bacterium]|nr:hypothetical protein [Thermoguttaceae bacterium]